MSSNEQEDVFLVFGLSHKTAPLKIRERLAVHGEELEKLYYRFLESGLFKGLIILSTCNRMELYAVTQDPARTKECIQRELNARLDIPSEQAKPYFYDYSGERAIEHLFQVTAGLDSMVLGEPQIAGQVKEAFSMAVKLDATESQVNKLAHRAFNISKKIRTETDIQRQPVSVPYAAVVLAEQIFGDLSGKTVFLLGAGQMSELAATHLVERKIASLLVTNRSPEKAKELARRYKGHSLPFEDYPNHLYEADIVLTSTSAKDFLISVDHVREAMKRRKNQAMFFIDIGVPRDVDPAVNELMNVYLFDIDDLQQVVDENLDDRQQAATRARAMIREEVALFREYLKARDVSATIRILTRHMEELRFQEVEKLTRKLSHLEPMLRDSILQSIRGVTNKILHRPIRWLKEPTSDLERNGRDEVIRQIFGLGNEEEEPDSSKDPTQGNP